MKRSTFMIILLSSIFIISYAQNVDKNAIKRNIENQYIQMCAQLNKQVPIRVDEITVVKSMTFVNWTLTTYYSVDIDQDEYDSQCLKHFIDELRLVKKMQIPSMISNGAYNFTQEELCEYLKGTGMKFRFVYHDKNDIQIGAMQFDYTDFE